MACLNHCVQHSRALQINPTLSVVTIRQTPYTHEIALKMTKNRRNYPAHPRGEYWYRLMMINQLMILGNRHVMHSLRCVA